MIDHLVYAVPDLEAGVAELAGRLGVRAAPGGKHPGLGTHNALLALDSGAYLEIIAPDPSQSSPDRPRPFDLDTLSEPRLVTWAAKAPDIEQRVERARSAGYDPGPVIEIGRDTPDGTHLQWRLSFRAELTGDGLVPFLIDWGDAHHPSESAPKGCRLLSLVGYHPQPELIQDMLQALEIDITLKDGAIPALVAALDSPNGQVELR